MNERSSSFQRFDPDRDNHVDYLAAGSADQEHLLVVSTLTGIFNPLVAEFAASIDETKASILLDDSSLSVSTRKLYPSVSVNAELFDLNKHGIRDINASIILEHQPDTVSLPTQALVGNYGEELAISLVKSAGILHTLLESNDSEKYSAIDRRYEKFLEEETFNAFVRPTLHEGIQSIVAGLSLLTIDQVEGYESDPMKLCHDLIHNNLLEEFAALVPNGYVFPMVIDGIAFTNPLENKDGTLSLSQELKRNLRVQHLEAQKAAVPGSRARGCPAAARTISNVAGKSSGITLLGQKMLPLLASQYDELLKTR